MALYASKALSAKYRCHNCNVFERSSLGFSNLDCFSGNGCMEVALPYSMVLLFHVVMRFGRSVKAVSLGIFKRQCFS